MLRNEKRRAFYLIADRLDTAGQVSTSSSGQVMGDAGQPRDLVGVESVIASRPSVTLVDQPSLDPP